MAAIRQWPSATHEQIREFSRNLAVLIWAGLLGQGIELKAFYQSPDAYTLLTMIISGTIIACMLGARVPSPFRTHLFKPIEEATLNGEQQRILNLVRGVESRRILFCIAILWGLGFLVICYAMWRIAHTQIDWQLSARTLLGGVVELLLYLPSVLAFQWWFVLLTVKKKISGGSLGSD